MSVQTGVFFDWRTHHRRWFSIFRGRHHFEIWFGNRWMTVSWGSL